MDASSALTDFFTQMSNLGTVVVQDLPKLDLDLYIQNYRGRTRFDRLLFVGKTCVPLCLDALKAAVAEAKAGSDIKRYQEALGYLRDAAPHEPEAVRDEAWIQETERANKAETARLEAELKAYKNNLIKDCIRMGNEDIGKHFENIGLLSEASEAYSRMRPDASTTRQIIDSGMYLIGVSLQRRDWTQVVNNLGKISGVQSPEEDKFPPTYIKIVAGIALLGLESYAEAAKNFLKIDCRVPSSAYRHVVSVNDIAIYGGLLALATMERDELSSQVLLNQSFRTFLEHEPHIRKAISLFINGRYANCLSILESYRNDYLLDMYLHSHVSEIYSKIRNKCIVQYLVPFSCVNLGNLEAAFGLSGQSVQDELVTMIRSGTLKARIDAKNNLLIADQAKPRVTMQRHALETARKYEEEAKERLRRISLIAAGLEVHGQNRLPSVGSRAGADDSWFDETSAQGSVQIEG